jgi:hypothetical protein
MCVRVTQYSDGLQAGGLGFNSRQEQGIFLFSTASRPALGPIQSSIKLVTGHISLGVKRLEREAYGSPPSNA